MKKEIAKYFDIDEKEIKTGSFTFDPKKQKKAEKEFIIMVRKESKNIEIPICKCGSLEVYFDSLKCVKCGEKTDLILKFDI